jgi:hypothetical protein
MREILGGLGRICMIVLPITIPIFEMLPRRSSQPQSRREGANEHIELVWSTAI